LKKELDSKLKSVHSKRSTLPESFGDNPQAHLLALCNNFLADLDAYTSGKSNSDPDQVTFLREALPSYKGLQDLIQETRPKFKIPCALATAVENPQPPETVATTSCQRTVEEISLSEVAKVISEMSSRELYGIVPFRVHEHFIRSFSSDWQNISFNCFEAAECLLKRRVADLCNRHFGRFASSGLHYEAR